MSRIYLLFGSNDGETFKKLGEAAAGGGDQALNAARLEGQYEHYSVCPKRNWAQKTPTVKQRDPVVTWEPLGGDQLTVDDVIDEIEKKEPPAKDVVEATDALADRAAQTLEEKKRQAQEDDAA